MQALAAQLVLDDVTLAFDDTPAQDPATTAPPVILVHGLAASRRIWDDLMPALRDRRVVRIDLRGHGDSGGPADPDAYRIAAVAEDLAAVVDALGLRGADVVAHSLGGASTMWAALADPGLFGRIVLIGTWALGCPRSAAHALRAEARAYARHGMLAIYDATVANRESDPALGERFRTDAAFAAARRDEMARLRPEAWSGFVDEILQDRSFLAWTRGLTAPTTLICGAHDPFLDAMHDIAAHAAGAAAPVHVLATSGHNPMNDAPDDVAALVRAALRA